MKRMTPAEVRDMAGHVANSVFAAERLVSPGFTPMNGQLKKQVEAAAKTCFIGQFCETINEHSYTAAVQYGTLAMREVLKEQFIFELEPKPIVMKKQSNNGRHKLFRELVLSAKKDMGNKVFPFLTSHLEQHKKSLFTAIDAALEPLKEQYKTSAETTTEITNIFYEAAQKATNAYSERNKLVVKVASVA